MLAYKPARSAWVRSVLAMCVGGQRFSLHCTALLALRVTHVAHTLTATTISHVDTRRVGIHNHYNSTVPAFGLLVRPLHGVDDGHVQRA